MYSFEKKIKWQIHFKANILMLKEVFLSYCLFLRNGTKVSKSQWIWEMLLQAAWHFSHWNFCADWKPWQALNYIYIFHWKITVRYVNTEPRHLSMFMQMIMKLINNLLKSVYFKWLKKMSKNLVLQCLWNQLGCKEIMSIMNIVNVFTQHTDYLCMF